MNTEYNYQICSRCVSDTTIPNIKFDEQGVCNYCQIHNHLNEQFPLNDMGQKKLNHIIRKIKNEGKNRKYDCVVGVSGGTDSTFCLYLIKKMGLSPLAVHFDNGWNSEVSIKNINNAINKLNVDLKVIRVDFEEFRDLQRSFLYASVPDAEIPTDIAIHAVLHRTAVENNVRWIINGMNFRTEGIQPLEWSYMDSKYVTSVHEMFGHRPLVIYPNLTIPDMIRFSLFNGINTVPLLAFMNYSKEESKEIIRHELDWSNYGGHHFESIYTRFVITDLLWPKFGIDKRMIQLSASVRSGKLLRDAALEILESPPKSDIEVLKAVLEKIGLTNGEFKDILSLSPKTFHDYPTNYPIIKALKWPIMLACSLNLIPKIFYEKYLGAQT